MARKTTKFIVEIELDDHSGNAYDMQYVEQAQTSIQFFLNYGLEKYHPTVTPLAE